MTLTERLRAIWTRITTRPLRGYTQFQTHAAEQAQSSGPPQYNTSATLGAALPDGPAAARGGDGFGPPVANQQRIIFPIPGLVPGPSAGRAAPTRPMTPPTRGQNNA